MKFSGDLHKAMDVLETLIAKAVLQTSVDQLAIVGGTLQVPNENAEGLTTLVHPNSSPKTIEQLLAEENKNILISRQSSTVADIHIRKLLSMETNYLQSVLENTFHELDQSRAFFSLQESVGKSKTRTKEKHDLKERELGLRAEISSLRVLMNKKTRDAETHILESNLLIAKLKDELTEAKRSTKGEEEFVSKLERVRESERVALFDEEEQEMVQKRDNYKRDIEYEHRVTVEIESWLNERRSHLKELLQFWIEKSKVDITAKEAQLQELITNREADLKRKEEAEQRLKDARQYVEAELARREEIRIEQEQQEVQIRTTVRIQAWWRMIMVRKGFGQFKKKKPTQPEPKKNGLRK